MFIPFPKSVAFDCYKCGITGDCDDPFSPGPTENGCAQCMKVKYEYLGASGRLL